MQISQLLSYFAQILRKKPDFKQKPWPTISASAKDFVKKLLVKDPRVRMSAGQALCTHYSHVLIGSFMVYHNEKLRTFDIVEFP